MQQSKFFFVVVGKLMDSLWAEATPTMTLADKIAAEWTRKGYKNVDVRIQPLDNAISVGDRK